MPVADYYDATKWEIGDENRGLFQREKKSIDYILKYFKKGKHFLDIGCGDGLFMSHLNSNLAKNHKKELWGVDYSHYKLKQAKKAGHKVKHCDLEQGIPFKDQSFDVIYAAELIEHLYDPDKFLEECRRILKKNGVVVISTPNLHAWYNRALFALGIQPLFYEVSTRSPHIGSGPLKKIKKGKVPVGHVRVFSPASLKDMLVAEGFEILHVAGANFHALPKPALMIDNLMNHLPSMASNTVVVARRAE